MAKLSVPLAALAMLAGCGGPSDLYPLKVGTEWTYTVKNKFAERIQKVTVARRLPVAYTTGYELSGPMGISRIAWRGATLYAEVLPNTRIYTPIPILIANDPKATQTWRGTIETMGQAQPAQAVLRQEPDTVDIGTKKLDTIKATLTVTVPNRAIELETWYAKGIGPVRQDQRTNGQLDVHTELLGAP